MSETAPNRGEVLSKYQTALVRVEVTGRDLDGKVAPVRVGNGVVVGPNGLIVTAEHVVGKDDDWAETAPKSGLRDRSVKVTGLDEQGVERSLGNASVWSIPGYDLALLRVRAQNFQTPPLADQVPRNDASLVALLWDPRSVPAPVSADLVPTDASRFNGLLTVLIRVVEGNSGSGLFDAQFRLAAVIVNRLDDHRALAIPVAWIKQIVDSQVSPCTTKTAADDGATAAGATAQTGSAELEMAVAKIEKLQQRLSLVARELAWIDRSHANGWYELLELRKEIDPFGDLVQCHRIYSIHGPDSGAIESLPYGFRSAPELGTCVLDQVTDQHNVLWSPDLPRPSTKLEGKLVLNPPATAQKVHPGFTVKSRLFNSFAMTTLDAEHRGHSSIEDTTMGAAFPVRCLRLVVFFPAGYEPTEIRVLARRPTNVDLPIDQWPEETVETARITPNLFFDRDRGCAVLTVEQHFPEHHYVLSWKLPPPPEPPWAEVTRAHDQLRALFGLGERERGEVETILCSIRDEIYATYFRGRRKRKPNIHLSLLAFDEEEAVTRVVLTTRDDQARNATFPWGVCVHGWVMRRRRPVFVDTFDRHTAGIYRPIEGMPQERHLLCVPLPLPTDSDHRNELLLSPVMPCLVAALTCADESGNMALLKEPVRPANVESGRVQAAVSSMVAEKLLDLISESPLS